MIKRLQLSCFALLFCLFLNAQSYTVSGVVKDDKQAPLSYASVILLSADGESIINGTSTDDNGEYALTNISSGDYTLSISFIGFEKQELKIQVNSDKTIHAIVLKEDSQALETIEITYKKPTIEKKPDRLTFNITNTALSEGSMLEAISKTPGVFVKDNSISIKNQAVNVYINNKRVYLNANDLIQLLESTPANAIKSIDVITNPSAQYDATETAVINITMTKNLITGYHGRLYSNYTQGVFPRYAFGSSNFFKHKRLSLFANYGYIANKINRGNVEVYNYLNPDNSLASIWNSNFNRNEKSENNTINLNADFTINNKHALSFNSNILLNTYFKGNIHGITNIMDANSVLTSYFNNNNISRKTKYNLAFDLGYNWTISDKSTIKFNGHYTNYDNKRNQDVSSNYFDNANTLTESTSFSTNANQDTELLISQIDFTNSFGNASSLALGIKTSFTNNNSAINYFDIVNISSLANANDDFTYKENVYAAYINYESNYKKWSYNLGVRFEQTDIEGISNSTNTTNIQKYSNGFPNASISYQATDNWSIYSNYKKSLTRPSYASINPFSFFLNDNTLVVGNTNLQPVFIDHFVIGSSYKSFTFEFYYKKLKGNLFEIPIQNNNLNQIVYTPVNIDNTTELGFDFIYYFNLSKRWFVYAVTSFYNTQDNNNFNLGNISQDLWANYSILSNSFSFLKDKSLKGNFNLIYASKNIQGFQVSRSQIHTNLSLTKTVFNKKGTISLTVEDLFNRQDFFITSRYLNQNNSRGLDVDSRFVKLGFSYKLGNTRLKTNQRDIDNKERDRLNSQQQF